MDQQHYEELPTGTWRPEADVEPLTRALRASFPCGSLWLQYLVIAGCLAGTLAILMVALFCRAPSPVLGIPLMTGSLLVYAVLDAMRQKEKRRNLIEALDQIARQHPV